MQDANVGGNNTALTPRRKTHKRSRSKMGKSFCAHCQTASAKDCLKLKTNKSKFCVSFFF